MEDRRFLREEMMLGPEALERLRRAHVIVFGIGGVGSYTVEALARAGVGALTLVDSDTVGETNINRQLCALQSTLGRYKAEVMAERVRDINPDCCVRALDLLYTDETREQFFDRPYDYIVDAIDLVSCKLSLIQRAREQGIPIISAMGTGNKLDPTQFRITDISKTSGCHLARIMRRELRNRGIEHHTVLFSQELPRTPLELETPPPGRRSIPASVSWVPSCAGLMLAGHVVMELVSAES
ncbi:MAG: tRNA threonylcarbamoyladenosine dehydratase [Oscillospiraceae bacterium]|nr:tRNA threonylcarbamoyladenosine dehydratase [Oscillospiraceae bacterium]